MGRGWIVHQGRAALSPPQTGTRTASRTPDSPSPPPGSSYPWTTVASSCARRERGGSVPCTAGAVPGRARCGLWWAVRSAPRNGRHIAPARRWTRRRSASCKATGPGSTLARAGGRPLTPREWRPAPELSAWRFGHGCNARVKDRHTCRLTDPAGGARAVASRPWSGRRGQALGRLLMLLDGVTEPDG